MGRSILVIGGAGYIGPIVINDLLNAGNEVTCLDMLIYENNTCAGQFFGNKNFRFIFGDMGDRNILNRALEGVSDVIILAGLVGDPITKRYPIFAEAINSRGLLSCIKNLDGVGLDRVVFVSTCSNYGMIDSGDLADEEYPLNPLSLYSKAKVEAESFLLAARGSVDYSPTILRFATAFGVAPRMRFDLTVNEFTRELALGKELLVFDEKTWRPYCHVRDFSRLISLVLAAPSKDVAFEVFNAGGDINNFTKEGILEEIRRFLPNAKIKYQANGADPRNYRVNFAKVRETLSFEPEFNIKFGISEILNALNEHVYDRVDQMKNYHGNYEINK